VFFVIIIDVDPAVNVNPMENTAPADVAYRNRHNYPVVAQSSSHATRIHTYTSRPYTESVVPLYLATMFDRTDTILFFPPSVLFFPFSPRSLSPSLSLSLLSKIIPLNSLRLDDAAHSVPPPLSFIHFSSRRTLFSFLRRGRQRTQFNPLASERRRRHRRCRRRRSRGTSRRRSRHTCSSCSRLAVRQLL